MQVRQRFPYPDLIGKSEVPGKMDQYSSQLARPKALFRLGLTLDSAMVRTQRLLSIRQVVKNRSGTLRSSTMSLRSRFAQKLPPQELDFKGPLSVLRS